MSNLEKTAKLTAAFIGHSLAPFLKYGDKRISGCEICGLTVEINGKISGSAVVEPCLKRGAK